MTFTDTLKKLSPKSAFAHFDNRLKYEVGPVELKRKIDEGDTNFQIIDVRSREVFGDGHIPGAKMIPFEEFRMRMPEFSETRENVVYCYSMQCQLGDKAARWLAEKGYPVRLLIGGFDTWDKSGQPTEK
jgi:rhodanese-related sulfurtransferase